MKWLVTYLEIFLTFRCGKGVVGEPLGELFSDMCLGSFVFALGTWDGLGHGVLMLLMWLLLYRALVPRCQTVRSPVPFPDPARPVGGVGSYFLDRTGPQEARSFSFSEGKVAPSPSILGTEF